MHLIVSTAPPDKAESLIETLVNERLIACGNILPGARSLYRWKGEVHRDEECVLLMETSEEQLVPMRSRLQELHPYETPKILTLGVSHANPDFLAWVRAQCGPERD